MCTGPEFISQGQNQNGACSKLGYCSMAEQTPIKFISFVLLCKCTLPFELKDLYLSGQLFFFTKQSYYILHSEVANYYAISHFRVRFDRILLSGTMTFLIQVTT